MRIFICSGGQMHFDDLNSENSYSPLKAYDQSKLANVLFTKELAYKLKGKSIWSILASRFNSHDNSLFSPCQCNLVEMNTLLF